MLITVSNSLLNLLLCPTKAKDIFLAIIWQQTHSNKSHEKLEPLFGISARKMIKGMKQLSK